MADFPGEHAPGCVNHPCAPTPTIISSSGIFDQVCHALELNSHIVQRIVLDLNAMEPNEPLPVYVQMIGTNRLIEVQWNKLNGVDITIVEK